ncbi:MAG: aminopeptidase [Solirubrobacterales bacterium]|nr:aminopeptidase [Solirubrobacterales bacterium]
MRAGGSSSCRLRTEARSVSERSSEVHAARALAELIVGFGANVQPGQIVAVSSEPGKEGLARAVAEAAYDRGALFVDLSVFDLHFKRARALRAAPDTLEFVPPWYGERVRALGEHRCATVSLTGPVAPRLMDGVDPALLGKDLLPRIKESIEVVNERTVNWTVAPCPTPDWAELVYPELEPAEALERLWEEIAHACRLDEDDPVATWVRRMERLESVARRLAELELDLLRFEGPGTDLSIGLFASSRWQCARISTVDGITHAPNIPTEEVFTAPDPARVEGVVRSSKPLFVSGVRIEGLRVRFEGGRAVEIDADHGAETLRAMTEHDAGAARLGEVALVDRDSRIGQLGTVFFETLLDENAASHIALGEGFDFAVDRYADRERINRSDLHLDFMVGSDDVLVTGVAHAGREVPLLRHGDWQI